MGWRNGGIIGSTEDYGDHVELVHVKELLRHVISTPIIRKKKCYFPVETADCSIYITNVTWTFSGLDISK